MSPPFVAFEISCGPPEQQQLDKGGGGFNKFASRSIGAATAEEVAPLVRRLGSFVDAVEESARTDPSQLLSGCCEEFRPRNLQSFHVLGWFTLQVVGLFFQFALLLEIRQHLTAFEGWLAVHCGPEHQRSGDICIGPAWAVSFSGVLAFAPSPASAEELGAEASFDEVIRSAERFGPFPLRSQPPTFLVHVEPLPPHENVAWHLALTTESPEGIRWSYVHLGDSQRTLESLTGTGSQYLVLSPSFYSITSAWVGNMYLTSKTEDPVQIQVTVVDSRLEHLGQVHNQTQCSFKQTWQNFSNRHSGKHHMVLFYTERAIQLFLFISLLLVAVVGHRIYFRRESGRLLRHAIAVKFAAMDVPQQVCIVAYIYGWYASNGLRCQMCIFHPDHCEVESPMHWSNFMACLFTALSASANQLLIKAKAKGKRDEDSCDDDLCLCLFRFALFSVSVLPFSTGVYLSVLWFKTDHVVLTCLAAVVPFAVGWLSACCGWICISFKDEFDQL